MSKNLLISVMLLLLSGTIFYHLIEHWSILDSVYFTSTTLTTVGFGDLVPQTVAGKIFTIFYMFSGIGVIFSFLNSIAQRRQMNKAVEIITKLNDK